MNTDQARRGETAFDSLEGARSFLDRLVRTGYYVRYNVDLKGESEAIHRIDILCESPSDKIVGFRTAAEATQAETDFLENEIFLDERGFGRVVTAMVVSFDLRAKAFLLVREGELGNIGWDLANQNGIVLLKEEKI